MRTAGRLPLSAPSGRKLKTGPRLGCAGGEREWDSINQGLPCTQLSSAWKLVWLMENEVPRRNSRVSWQDNGIAYATTSGRGQRDRQSRSGDQELRPVRLRRQRIATRNERKTTTTTDSWDRAASHRNPRRIGETPSARPSRVKSTWKLLHKEAYVSTAEPSVVLRNWR